MPNVRVAIIGAGPAGLTAALSAMKLGLEADVFEQAASFARVGGGVLLHSNGQRVLDTLGLLRSLGPAMQPSQLLTLELSSGRALCTFDYRKLGIPYNRVAVMMRYILEEHLLTAAKREGITILFDHRCIAASFRDEAVRLQFADRRERNYDVVIAADGIHSPVRESLGFLTEQRTIGEAYLRGIARLRLDDAVVREIWCPGGRRFGICPLPGGQTYFYCSVPLGQWPGIRRRRLGEWIESWRDCGPRIWSVLQAVEDWRVVTYDEIHEVSVRRWSRPPVFLVGDAVHAMTPNLGQGANSAMVDALVLTRLLARALRTGGSLEEIGSRYESTRRPLVDRIQRTGRWLGAAGLLVVGIS